MAYDTLQDALNALASTPVTTDGLLNLVKQTSIQADGAVTLLYSGPIGDVEQRGQVYHRVEQSMNKGVKSIIA